ncbi:MAG: hypothetical protein KAG62_02580 [Caulobacter sp.]|nr:hypothetical protein [Caulobacter sp.]
MPPPAARAPHVSAKGVQAKASRLKARLWALLGKAGDVGQDLAEVRARPPRSPRI